MVKRSREKLELEADHFTLLLRDGVIIGCVGLYPYPDDGMGEVAGLVAHPDYQDTGHGNRLLENQSSGPPRIVKTLCLTTQWRVNHQAPATVPQTCTVKYAVPANPGRING